LRWAEGKIGKQLTILGAPAGDANYEIALPAELAEKVVLDAEDPRVQGFLEVARKHDLNQDFVNEVMQSVAAKVQQEAEAELQAELGKLGDQGPQRLRDLSDLLDARLGTETAATLKGMFTSAAVFEAFESLVQKLAPPAFATKNDLASTVNERASLQQQWQEKYFAVDERGQRKVAVDDKYRREVEALRDRAFGTTRRDASGRPVDESGQRVTA
jgi:hypothetical protein